MDSRVLQTQKWLNKTYGNIDGFPTIDEDGRTGQATFKALIYALQIEIGCSKPDGVFGNDTLSKCPTLKESLIPESDVPKNIIYILQGSLWCKGISPGGFTGIFGSLTAKAVATFQTLAGITPDKIVYPYILKGIMNTNGYGFKETNDVYDTYKHQIQMGLNKYYGSTIGLIAPNGLWDRNSQKNLIKALQIEWGTTVDGGFGPGTLKKAPTLSVNTNGFTNSKRILQWCLTINGFFPGFSESFDNNTYTSLKKFQDFIGLNPDGICGKQTWASLVTSKGSSDRKATALDTATKITTANAAAIKAAGYTDIGRYLTNASVDGALNKALTYDEMEILITEGLNIFPIFQTSGNSAAYFSATQGSKDAVEAMKAAQNFGFPSSATIYFSVDFDVLFADIESKIIPYFDAAKKILSNVYKLGVYAPRYVCTKLAENNLCSSSFVCDMSSGFTCNIGQKMPENWAYDQFTTVGKKDSEFANMDYDKCIASPRRTATAPQNFLPGFVGYDNSRYTYEDVLSGTGYFRPDSKLRYSSGVETMQKKLNVAGYSCGFPDGRFSTGTLAAIYNLEYDFGLPTSSNVSKDFLMVLESCKSTTSDARNLRRRHGSTIAEISVNTGIDEDVLGGILLTESGGIGLINNTLKIRFENHTFLEAVGNAPAAVSVFKIENDIHYYYKDGEWKKTHGNGQTSEYEAFELASTIDSEAACKAISMGLPQIMGGNYECINHKDDQGKIALCKSATDMYNFFKDDELNQLSGYKDFLLSYRDGALLAACKARDFYQIGQIYNGNGAAYQKPLTENTEYYSISYI